MTLLNRLLLLLFGAGIIPIIPAEFFLFYYQSQAKNNILQFESGVSQMASMVVERETEDIARRLERMWEPGSRFVDEAGLKRALRMNPEFLYMAFLNRDGREVLSGGASEFKRVYGLMNLGGDPLFLAAARTGQPAIGRFERVYDMPVCSLIYPVEGGYYAFAAVNLKDLEEKLGGLRLGSTGGVLLADSEGGALAMSRTLERFDHQAVTSMLALGPLFEFAGQRGVYIGASTRVKGHGLYAIALEDRSEAFSGINRITWLMTFLILAVATAFYLSALAFTRSLALPMGELLAGAARVSSGDFKTPVTSSTQFAELGQLLAAFNSMMKELERYHGIQVEKLFEEKQKLELLVSLIRDAIILSDFKGDLLYANAAAKALLKSPEGIDLQGESLRRKVAEFVYLKSSSKDGVIELASPGGKKNFVVSIQTLASKTQSPAVFMVLHDVTLEREIQRVKDDFFHSVAHDLRAPLLTMQGYIKLLGREFSDGSKQAGYVASVKDSSARLFQMLENVLDISRMEAGRLKPDLANIDAAEFLSTVAEGFRPLFDEKGIALTLDASGAAGAKFKGDSALLRRVLENLLSNALKFTPAGGKVTAAAGHAGGGLQFSVTDSGPGIPPAELETVFDKYKRLNEGEGEPGFGLGLSIARKIVELHGGRIWAEAGPGGKFMFTLQKQ